MWTADISSATGRGQLDQSPPLAISSITESRACRVNDHSEHQATSQSLAQFGIDDSGRTQAYGALPEER